MCQPVSMPCLVGAVQQGKNVPFFHGDLARTLLLIVIESQDQLFPGLIIHGSHLLLKIQRKTYTIKGRPRCVLQAHDRIQLCPKFTTYTFESSSLKLPIKFYSSCLISFKNLILNWPIVNLPITRMWLTVIHLLAVSGPRLFPVHTLTGSDGELARYLPGMTEPAPAEPGCCCHRH